ncbi:MAG: TlpA family protein disulfide reductase [Tissierellia bacterium]|jgi:peroxiredoxin|nr:TlpA family protein disulfide reductase [Tissierellia bacterium]
MKKVLLLLGLLLFVAGCSQGEEVIGQADGPTEIVLETQEVEKEESKEINIGNRVGNLAPDFELNTMDGKSVKLSDLRGKPVHMVFWSVDCVYCVKELPHVQKIYNENKEDYTVLAMNITLQDGLDYAKEFIEEAGYDFTTVLIENTKEGLDTLQQYEVRGIPLNVFVDKEGIISYVAPGMMDEATINAVLKELID